MKLFTRDTRSTGDVKTLGAKGDMKGLAEALADPDVSVRADAAELLAAVARDIYLASHPVAPEPVVAAQKNAAELGVLRWLSDRKGTLRPDRLSEARALFNEPLVAMISHAEPGWVQEHAVRAALAFCDKQAVEPLIKIVRDNDGGDAIVRNAVEVLGVLRDARAAMPLAEVLANPSNQTWAVCDYAETALARLGEGAIDALAWCLEESTRAPRVNLGPGGPLLTSARLLAQTRSPKAAGALEAFASAHAEFAWHIPCGTYEALGLAPVARPPEIPDLDTLNRKIDDWSHHRGTARADRRQLLRRARALQADDATIHRIEALR